MVANKIELLDPNLVGVHSAHVMDVKEQIMAQLRQLVSDLEPLEHDFAGGAGRAFQALQGAAAERQSGLGNVLERVAVALSTVHNNFMTGEEEGAQDQRTVMADTVAIHNRINPQI